MLLSALPCTRLLIRPNMPFVTALRLKLRCENRGSLTVIAGGRAAPSTGSGSVSPTVNAKGCKHPRAPTRRRRLLLWQVDKNNGNQFGVKRKSNPAENSHWSGTSRSEFNFLFRDTAGFQTDLTGSGTPNWFPLSVVLQAVKKQTLYSKLFYLFYKSVTLPLNR